jgi:hypothetical protein
VAGARPRPAGKQRPAGAGVQFTSSWQVGRRRGRGCSICQAGRLGGGGGPEVACTLGSMAMHAAAMQQAPDPLLHSAGPPAHPLCSGCTPGRSWGRARWPACRGRRSRRGAGSDGAPQAGPGKAGRQGGEERGGCRGEGRGQGGGAPADRLGQLEAQVVGVKVSDAEALVADAHLPAWATGGWMAGEWDARRPALDSLTCHWHPGCC